MMVLMYYRAAVTQGTGRLSKGKRVSGFYIISVSIPQKT